MEWDLQSACVAGVQGHTRTASASARHCSHHRNVSAFNLQGKQWWKLPHAIKKENSHSHTRTDVLC
eukprot:2886485-Rhodomonas_salina.3